MSDPRRTIDLEPEEVTVLPRERQQPICDECAHCEKHFHDNHRYTLGCLATATRHPVTGRVTIHHKCRDKNRLGNCTDFKKKESDNSGCGCGCLIIIVIGILILKGLFS